MMPMKLKRTNALSLCKSNRLVSFNTYQELSCHRDQQRATFDPFVVDDADDDDDIQTKIKKRN